MIENLFISSDERGIVLNLSKFIPGLHIVSIEPGKERGRHIHKDQDEVICIIGKGAEIRLKEKDEEKIFRTTKQIEAFRIKKGVWHAIKNIGENPIYLVCFYI